LNRKPSKGVLIIVENQTYFLDTRVKAEAAALRGAGWQVHVICPAPPDDAHEAAKKAQYRTKDAGGISVHSYRVKFAGRGSIDFLREYSLSMAHIMRLSWRIFRDHGFSVVHLCNPPDILFVVGLFYKVLGKKVVFDHHDLFPEMIQARYKGVLRDAFYLAARALEFLTFRTAAVVLSTNQSYRETAIRRGRLKETRVFVVRNGPVLNEFYPGNPSPGLKKGFPFMACYAGLMGPEDGVIELIDVIRFVVQGLGRRDILFCLLGDGVARSTALERVRAWGLEACVDMPGMIVDRGQFRRYLATADIMLAPEMSTPANDISTFIKIAEYMAIGKPIVAYDLRETRFTAGGAAVYVRSGRQEAYASALVELLDDLDRRLVMGNIGIERVATKFQWELQKANLLEAYDHLLCPRSREG